MNKLLYFSDNKGNIYHGDIIINENKGILIYAYDKDENEVGYMHIYYPPNNRLFLDVIYCYEKYRQLGIASSLSELADFLFKDCQGHVIRGIYMPGQMSTDRMSKQKFGTMDNAARMFYAKNGYDVIGYSDYVLNKDKYPYINDSDFCLGEDDTDVIVAKVMQDKDYLYYEDNNEIKSLKLKR